MECEEIQTNINDLNTEESFFIVYDDKDNEYTISLHSSNNELIFEIIPKEDDIIFYDKNYISKNSFSDLKKKQNIFSKYNSLEEIKSLILKLLVKSDEICNFQKVDEKYILSVKGENELIFDFVPQEKNIKEIKEIIKKLITDNQRKDEKITKLENELLITKKELNEIKDEMNIFLGEGIYYICSALDNKKCFDIKIGKDCWYLVINDLNKKSNTQKFKVKTKDGIKHYIMNYYDDKIIEIKSYVNGTKILISDEITNKNNQCWYFIKNKEYICIKACDTLNLVIDVPNSMTKNETELNIWGFNGGLNQFWKFIKAE